MKKIKIVHVLGVLNRGGSETFIMNLYSNIDRKKITFDFIVHGDVHGHYEETLLGFGSTINRVPRYKGFNHFKYINSVKKILSKYNPETTIIHIHMMSVAKIVSKQAKIKGFKTIIHSHSTNNNGKNFIENIYRKILMQNVTKYSNLNLACSIEAGNFLFKQEKFTIMKNGIPLEKYLFNNEHRKKIREKYCLLNKGEILVGHVGRFDDAKNQKFVLEVFHKFNQEIPTSKLILIGEGKDKNTIEFEAKQKGIFDKVIFTGSISNVNEYMSAMDFFLFPSKYEGFGIVALEAQASGLPVLASDVIPRETKVTDRIFYYSLEKTAFEWKNKMVEIINTIDRLSDFNRDKLYDFDSKKVAQDYTNIILEMSENNE